MRDRNDTTIRLPVVRVRQLRAIAAARGRTLTEQVEAWIHAEIAAGTIGADLPGIDLSEIAPAWTAPIDRARAGAHDTLAKWQLAIAAVSRRGRAFVVMSPAGEELVMSESIFADLKAQVERAAAA